MNECRNNSEECKEVDGHLWYYLGGEVQARHRVCGSCNQKQELRWVVIR